MAEAGGRPVDGITKNDLPKEVLRPNQAMADDLERRAEAEQAIVRSEAPHPRFIFESRKARKERKRQLTGQSGLANIESNTGGNVTLDPGDQGYTPPDEVDFDAKAAEQAHAAALGMGEEAETPKTEVTEGAPEPGESANGLEELKRRIEEASAVTTEQGTEAPVQPEWSALEPLRAEMAAQESAGVPEAAGPVAEATQGGELPPLEAPSAQVPETPVQSSEQNPDSNAPESTPSLPQGSGEQPMTTETGSPETAESAPVPKTKEARLSQVFVDQMNDAENNPWFIRSAAARAGLLDVHEPEEEGGIRTYTARVPEGQAVLDALTARADRIEWVQRYKDEVASQKAAADAEGASDVEEGRTRFQRALDQELESMVETGKITVEQAAERRELAGGMKNGFSENPQDDARLFSRLGSEDIQDVIDAVAKAPEPEPKPEVAEKPAVEVPAEKEPTAPKPEKEPETPEEKAAVELEKVISFEARKERAEWLSVQLEALKRGELGPTEVKALISYLEAEKTTYTIIEETTRREGGPKANPDNVARYIDMLYEEEDYLNRMVSFDAGHDEVLKAFYESIKDGTRELTPEEFQSNLDFLIRARDNLASQIDRMQDRPDTALNPEEITADYNAEELSKGLGIYDQLIDALDAHNPNKSTTEVSRFEYEVTTISALLAELRMMTGGEVLDEEGEPKQDESEKIMITTPEKILIADVSEVVKAMAWRIAENRLNEIITRENTTGERGFLAGVTRFFRGSMAKLGERGYLRKFYNEALDELEENQDLRRTIEGRLWGDSVGVEQGRGDNSETFEVLDAVIEQMENDILEREEMGENLAEAGVHFQELFQRHMRGEFATREEFEQAATEVIRNLIETGVISRDQFTYEEGREADAEGLMFATNLWQMAEGNRQQVINKYEASGEWQKLSEEQKKAVMDHMASTANLDVQLALKLSDLQEMRAQRPDLRNGYLSGLENWADQVGKSHPILGVVINPTVMGYAASALISRGLRGVILAGVAVGGATGGFALAAPIIAGAVAGGVIAAVRRSRNLKYDRGMEQRREALGVEGEGRRAAELRERGFAGIAGDAEDLTARINAGDPGAAIEAAALLDAQRQLRVVGRPADLIFVGAEDAERTGTNITAITDLKLALRNYEELNGPLNEERVAERTTEIRDFVERQDERFESYRVRETVLAGAYGAITGAVAGIVAQEIGDRLFHGESAWGRSNNRITLLEYMRGQRPQAAEAEFFSIADGTPRGEEVHVGDIVKRPVTLPGKGVVEASYELKGFKNGQPEWEVKLPKLPKGFVYDPQQGTITHEVKGVNGGTRNPQEWLKARNQLSERFGLDKIRASWLKHATNGSGPTGDSYHAGYNPRSNASELEMDFIRRKDGSVVVSVARALGHTATGDGHRVTLRPENMDDFVATVSPHSRDVTGGQHDALALMFDSKGHSQPIPKELAEEIFAGRGTDLKNNMMITVNQVIGHDHGKTRLFEVMADLGNSKEGAIKIPGLKDVIKLPTIDGTYIPPVEEINVAEPPLAIPLDRRRPIGNPKKKEEEEEVDVEKSGLGQTGTLGDTGSGGFAGVAEMGAGMEAAEMATGATIATGATVAQAKPTTKKTKTEEPEKPKSTDSSTIEKMPSEADKERRPIFMAALEKKLDAMVKEGKLTEEDANGKRERGSIIDNSFSDDPEHDALMFAIAGVADEQELLEAIALGEKRKAEKTAKRVILPGETEPGNPADLVIPGGQNDVEPKSISDLEFPAGVEADLEKAKAQAVGGEVLVREMATSENPEGLMDQAVAAGYLTKNTDGSFEAIGELGERIREAYLFRLSDEAKLEEVRQSLAEGLTPKDAAYNTAKAEAENNEPVIDMTFASDRRPQPAEASQTETETKKEEAPKRQNRVEIEGLDTLTNQQLSDLFRKIDEIRNSPGAVSEKRNLLRSYLEENLGSSAAQLQTAVTGEHKVKIDKLSDDNFERFLGTLAARAGEVMEGR